MIYFAFICSHGNDEIFSCRGIQICVEEFQRRGHDRVTVMLPQSTRQRSTASRPMLDQDILERLKSRQLLSFTPSRRVGPIQYDCSDDEYV